MGSKNGIIKIEPRVFQTPTGYKLRTKLGSAKQFKTLEECLAAKKLDDEKHSHAKMWQDVEGEPNIQKRSDALGYYRSRVSAGGETHEKVSKDFQTVRLHRDYWLKKRTEAKAKKAAELGLNPKKKYKLGARVLVDRYIYLMPNNRYLVKIPRAQSKTFDSFEEAEKYRNDWIAQRPVKQKKVKEPKPKKAAKEPKLKKVKPPKPKKIKTPKPKSEKKTVYVNLMQKTEYDKIRAEAQKRKGTMEKGRAALNAGIRVIVAARATPTKPKTKPTISELIKQAKETGDFRASYLAALIDRNYRV